MTSISTGSPGPTAGLATLTVDLQVALDLHVEPGLVELVLRHPGRR